MKNKKILIPIVIICLILSGCGAGVMSNDKGAIGDVSLSTNSGGFFDSFENMAEDNVYEEAYPEENKSSYENSTDNEQIKSQDKLVYTCNLSIETLQYQDTMKSIKNRISEFNGIIESEREEDNDYYWYYENSYKTSGTYVSYLTVRIPTEKYEEFLSGMENFGKITSKSSNVVNISKTYYDTQATIESLQIQEERLLAMYDSAETIEDMIAVETRLTEVQTQLNQYKTQLAQMDTDVAYSTVNITVEEVMEYTPQTQTTFFGRLKDTIVDSCKWFVNALETILFTIIRLIPVLIILGVAGVIIYPIIKNTIKKRKNKKATKENPKN